MANPTLGTRIPIKLPWKGATDNKDQFVSMKDSVADFFGFEEATEQELTYKVKVQKKDKSDGEKVTGTVEVERPLRPGYRQRAIRVIFQKGKKGSGTKSSTLSGKAVKINNKEYKSLQFPITTSVPINEVVNFFKKGAGSKLGALRIVDVNTGQGYPVAQRKNRR